MTEFSGFSLSRVFWGVVWLGCLAGLGFSWLGLLGDRHWALDLMAHFRWQYLVAAVVIFFMAVGRRAWSMVMVSLATVVLNAWLIFGFVEAAGEPMEDGPELKVMCLNLLVANDEHERVLAEVRRIDPDVVMFEEVSLAWREPLLALASDYPHHKLQPTGVCGLAVFSKLPLQEILEIPFGSLGYPVLEATVSVGEKSIIIVGAHPLPPMSRRAFGGWAEHLEQLGAHVRERETPVIVMGDLNATPWCHGMRQLLRHSDLGFRLADAAASWCVAYPTWAVGSPMSIHIDHILCTPELVLDQYAVGEDVGSDHRPVVARVRWVN